MAQLSKEEFLARLQERMGDDTSDEALQFMEDMTDTYNALESAGGGDAENWKKKYEDNDAEWRKKYRDRFFSGSEDNSNNDPDDATNNNEPKTFDDLFTVKKED